MKPIHIFTAGEVVDNKGVKRRITAKHLAKVADNYNKKLPGSGNEAPLIIGHEFNSKETDRPAFGWFGEMLNRGDKLYGVPSFIHPTAKTLVDQGYYKNVSAALYISPETGDPIGVQHVALLGGVQPAVPNLEPIRFSSAAADTVSFTAEFSEYDPTTASYAMKSIGALFQGVRDWIIAEKGVEAADKVLPQWDIDNLKDIDPPVVPAASFSESSTKSTTQPGESMPMTAEEQKQYDDLAAKVKDQEGQIAQFSEQVTQLTTKSTALESENIALKTAAVKSARDARTAEFSRFVDDLVAKQQLAPKHKDTVLSRMEILHQAGCTAEFSEGGSNAGKPTPLDEYKDELSKAPKVVEFSETATHATAGGTLKTNDPVEIAKRITAYRKEQEEKGNVVSFSEAADHVCAQMNPA